MTKLVYAWVFLGAAAIVAYYLYKSIQKKECSGNALCKMLGCALAAIFAYVMTLVTNTYQIMSMGNSMVFMLLDWTAFFFFQYTYYLTGNHNFPRKSKTVLTVALIIDNIVLAINPVHEIALTYQESWVEQELYLIFEPYMWFGVHLAICYVLFLGAGVLLVRKCIQSPSVYQKRYLIILIGTIIVLAANAFFLKIGLIVDVSIVLYSMLACVLYFYTYQYEPYGLIFDTKEYILNQMMDPVLLFDHENKLMMYNKSAADFFQIEEKMTLSQFCTRNPYLTPNHEKKHDILEVILERDGVSKWYQIQYQRLTDEKDRFTGTMMIYNEVPAQKRAMEQLEYHVTHDQLTNLFNRNYVNQHRIGKSFAFPMPISVGVFNINGLKLINDFYGLDIGDRVLCYVADCLKDAAREKDRIVRMDGDEMLFLMPETQSKEAEEILIRVSEKINQSAVEGIHISVEYGQSLIPSVESDQQVILEEARKEMIQKKLMNKDSVRSSIMRSLEKSLLESDLETEQHAERTREISMKLGKKLGLRPKEIGQLGLLATLHDIGKVSVPEHILHKKDKLNEEEWEIMKAHTVKGYEIAMITPELSHIAKFILCHHERWDGKGYPYGLKGEEIPLLSRIITVVDSHDVMTHDRPYHKAMSEEEAIEELKRCAGTQFDPKIVQIFIQMLEEKALSA